MTIPRTCGSSAHSPTPAIPADRDEFESALATLAKALGHPVRVRILGMLAERKECICGDLVDGTDLAQSTVSQHLTVLKKAGLIQGEVDGPRVCYCLNQDTLRRFKILVAAL
jgi:ArsR family transcriptional regulator, arsenate/arsenite/antimonite-responsive transcriptional repressor